MPTSPIASAQAATPSSDVRKPGGLEAMTTEDFFRLLVTELRQQDPLEPTRTSDTISNVSQIRSIEMSSTMNKTLELLARQQRGAGAADLIGKYVTATMQDDAGQSVTAAGIVTSVRFDAAGQSLLDLDTGQTVRLVDVSSIAAPDAAHLPPPEPTGVAPERTAPGEPRLAEKAPAARRRSPLDRLIPRWLRLDRA